MEAKLGSQFIRKKRRDKRRKVYKSRNKMIPDKKRVRKDISRMWALEGSECIRTGCVTIGLLPLVLTFPTCSIVTSHLEGDEEIDSVGSHVSPLNYTLTPIPPSTPSGQSCLFDQAIIFTTPS
jgi:hypothetical protein